MKRSTTTLLSRRGWVTAAALIAAIVGIVAAYGAPRASAGDTQSDSGTAPAAPRSPWPQASVETARALPIQEGGRVMPLSQWARYTLLKLNGRASVKDPSGVTLEPTAWALDVMFRPELAARYEVFLVDTSEVLDGIGYEAKEGKKKRDRYSYVDLAPARARLRALADEYARIDAKDRSAVQGGTIALESSINSFVGLANLLECARLEFATEEIPETRSIFGEAKSTVRGSDVLAHLRDLDAAAREGAGKRSAQASALLGEVEKAFAAGDEFAFVPPTAEQSAEEAWYTPAKLYARAHARLGLDPPYLALLYDLEKATGAAASDDMGAWSKAFASAAGRVTLRAQARGEGDHIGLEVTLLRLDPFFWARTIYLVAFLLVAASWMWPRRWILISVWSLLGAGLLLHAAGIVMRCIIQGHPPVKSLYETTLFIAWCGIVLALIVERISRRGFALALAPIFGVISLYISSGYDTIQAEDTMRPVVAVLDTNFWLTIHVLCISLGYCVSLISSLIAHIHVGVRLFRRDPDFERALARYTYGTLAFGLLLSTVGTILGGVWANDSWGRFWGWDPKENGALMIVLAELAVLHGRLGGMLSPFGVSLGAIASGCVVAFSWWGVNLLGVGLHSYGFTAGLWSGLLTFWGIEALVLAAGIWGGRRKPAPTTGAAAPGSVAPA